MKVLWWSNHPTAPTGYGTQTALWTRRLRDTGHTVIISANYAGEPRAHEWEGIPVLPPGEHKFGCDSLTRDVAAVDPDLVWCLYDSWAITPTPLKGRLSAIWAPVDHSPIPPICMATFTESGAVPVAYSQYARVSFEANGLAPLYVPHGIDTNVFRPYDRAEARARLQLPQDVFLVGMVAANKSGGYLRKGWDVAFEAFSWLAKQHDNVHLYCHTKPDSLLGLDLRVCARNYEIPGEHLTFLPQATFEYGIPDEKMAWVYSAFDVLLAPSLGEGFCLPLVEAQACGTPVIATDATAQAELVGAGWKAQGHYLYDSEQAADWVRPYNFEVKRCLAEAYERPDLRGQARDFALQYDADKVWADYWLPALANLEARIPSTGPLP